MHNLPDNFRHIRLVLAREAGCPEGDAQHGYDILAPLTCDDRFDVDTFKAHRTACRVRRFRPREDDAIGVLKRRRNGEWYFDYDPGKDDDDETVFRFMDETFRLGEYVSIREDDDEMHTFKVMQLETLD